MLGVVTIIMHVLDGSVPTPQLCCLKIVNYDVRENLVLLYFLANFVGFPFLHMTLALNREF